MHELATALRCILPAFVKVGHADPQLAYADIGPPGATPQRRAEFAAGRAAARLAIQALGHDACVIPMGDDRAPVWPPGLTGSISHTRTACLAAVATTPGVVALGIDLEPECAVDSTLWDEVLLPAEKAFVCASTAPARMATLIFCAKEAVYKAQYTLTRQLFGFERLLITPGPDYFTATFQAATGPIAKGTCWTGQHAHADGHILASLTRS
jgi:4'-phosphopantetheinyl transferase EntD